MTKKKILVVDYEEDNLFSLADLLESRGFQVSTAKDGLSGLKEFEAEKPDLVILEALLPKLHGFELCKKITNEYDRKVPVLVITGVYRKMKFKNEAIHLYGASAYFEKPFKEEELLTSISDLLEERKKEEIEEEIEETFLEPVPKEEIDSQEIVEKRFDEDKLNQIPLEPKAEQKREKVKEVKDLEQKLDETISNLKTEVLEKTKLKKEKEGKKEKVKDEIETKLEDTATEFGLEIKKKKPPKPVDRKIKKEEEPLPRLGEYILLEKIGLGGMGEVFKAKRRGVEGFEKMVAVKRIHSHLIEDNEKIITMFIDEAKLAAQLSHPNIVQIYDLGELDGYFFIAMEYVLGKDLGAILNRLKKKNKIMPYEYSAYVGIKICEALDYSHRKHDDSGKSLSIVHRDVSTKNILISFEGEVKLTDFGVAKAASKIHKTIPGGIKGKIPYMSPEQAHGKKIDHRSDIYSLGAVLFEMVTEEKVFSGDNDIVILDKVRRGEIIPPSLKNPDLPGELEDIILKSLQYEPQKRYQNALKLQEDLEKFIKKYKENIPSYRDITQFMVDLYVKEIKEKGLIIEPLREQKIFLEEKEKIIQEELPKPISVEPSISKQSEEKRIINRRYKIILADGSPIIKKIVNLAFSKEDYEIHAISDGQEVIKSLEQINPDIILLDINLPKKNGYEVCEFVKSNSKLVQTPIIILRGTFEKIDQERIKKLACNNFIQKPFNSTELVQKVKNILEKGKTAVTSL